MSIHVYAANILVVAYAAIAAAFDLKTRRIPNGLILAMLGTWTALLIYTLASNTDAALALLADSALGFAAGGGIFLAVYLISRKGLGGGDVKFMSMAGLYLGLAGTIPAILYGTILAALAGLILILIKKITRKGKMPLAPFLLAGIMATVIIQWTG